MAQYTPAQREVGGPQPDAINLTVTIDVSLDPSYVGYDTDERTLVDTLLARINEIPFVTAAS